MKRKNRICISKISFSMITIVMCFIIFSQKAYALTIKDSTVYTRAVYVIDWLDNKGKNRKFCLIKDNDQAYVGISQYMQYYDGATLVTITPQYIDGGAIDGGFGSTVHHVSPSPNKHRATSGHVLTLKYQGAHHAVFEWTQTIGGALETITYTFMDGNDYFQWQETMDASAGTLNGDSRGPYCTIKWDGVDFSASTGGEYAAAKYFSQPSYNGAWTFSGTADIPYVLEWDNNREIGYVQTQTFTQQLAGNPTWGGSLNLSSGDASVLDADVWKFDYQMNFYDKAKKITWGMPYGYMRGDAAAGTKNKWGQYSLSVVLDAMSDGGVKRVRDENRAIHNGNVSLTANTGYVTTQGQVGTANTAMQTLSPAGFDHNYRTWMLLANASGMLDIDMTVNGATALKNPTFRIQGFSALPSSVEYKGTTLTSGTDYYASYASSEEIWLTVLRNFSGVSNLKVSGSPATGISEGIKEKDLAAYPNPFSGSLYVETDPLQGDQSFEVSLINSIGEKVLTKETADPLLYLNTLDLSPGLYTLMVRKGETVLSRSIVKF